MGFSARFRWYHPTESNSIVYLFNFSELKNSNKTHFKNSKCMNKNFEKVFYLPIIIDNTFHIIYGIRTLFTIYFFYLFGSYLFFHHFFFRLAYYFFFYTLFFFSFHIYGRIPHIFIFRIYIYNIYHCQERISYYLDISIQKK